MAIFAGVMSLLLWFVELPIVYILNNENWESNVKWIPIVHGYVYPFYVFTAIHYSVRARYDIKKMIFFKNFIESEKWINDVQIYGRDKNNKHWSDNPKIEVTNPYDGLYKVVGMGDKLINKVVNKFNEGIYKGKDVNLKTSDFEFTT